jgi:hypothetical protein
MWVKSDTRRRAGLRQAAKRQAEVTAAEPNLIESNSASKSSRAIFIDENGGGPRSAATKAEPEEALSRVRFRFAL